MRVLRHILTCFPLVLPLQPGRPCSLLGTLLISVFFELAEALCLRSCFLLLIQLGQEERGQDHQSDQVRYPFFIVRLLHRAQGQPTCECSNCDLNTLTPRVHTENRLCAIDHNDFNALRPIVTLFFGQDGRQHRAR
jgi:hypothetical protein